MKFETRVDWGHIVLVAGIIFGAGVLSARVEAIDKYGSEPVRILKTELQQTREEVVKLRTQLELMTTQR